MVDGETLKFSYEIYWPSGERWRIDGAAEGAIKPPILPFGYHMRLEFSQTCNSNLTTFFKKSAVYLHFKFQVFWEIKNQIWQSNLLSSFFGYHMRLEFFVYFLMLPFSDVALLLSEFRTEKGTTNQSQRKQEKSNQVAAWINPEGRN